MVLPGETVRAYETSCDCGKELKLAIQQSAAGYYLGFFCPDCGPYSRESGYFKTRDAANAALRRGKFWR